MALYTKLDVVNRGLSLIGQLPINDVTTPHPDVPGILLHLELANKQVQSKKWWFNYETTTLIPQPDKRILIPDDAASLDACDKFNHVSQRGRYLYNNNNGTFDFEAPVPVYLHRVVPFEDLPPPAATYVTTQAMLGLESGLDGDGPRYRQLVAEDEAAYKALTAENTRQHRTNLLHRRGAQIALHRINQETPFMHRR